MAFLKRLKRLWILVLFALFVLAPAPLRACYLCTIVDPSVFAYTRFVSDAKDLSYIEVNWEFSKLYAFMSAQNYDKNIDGNIDAQELKNVYFDFYTLLEQNLYNTQLRINKKRVALEGKIFDKRLHLSYKKLSSSFKIRLDMPLDAIRTLSIDYIDKNELLAFFVKDAFLAHNFSPALGVKTNQDEVSLPLELKFTANAAQDPSKGAGASAQAQSASQAKGTQNAQNAQSSSAQGVQGAFIYLAEILNDISHKINLMLVDIKENKSVSALLSLLVFSFFYGLIHASGPGHGKSLVASYMLSHKKRVTKALSMALLIGFTHVFSAFIMTFGIYFLLNEFFSKYISDTQMVVTKLSGLIIIAIALYMLSKKLRIHRQNKKFRFSLHPAACTCGACKLSSNATDLGVIISAGIIPCPGTVTIFIFTLSLQTYAVGLISAILMGLGMSLVIFITAGLTIAFRSSLARSGLISFADYAGLVFICLLGFLLILG